MNLRDFLINHRDPNLIPMILDQVINGVDELHHLSYVHRKLNLDHIVMNADPLEVKIIDFKESIPIT